MGSESLTVQAPGADEFQYSGDLHLFEHAVNWKRYWVDQVRPFIGRRVLEVGAGIGTNTALMVPPTCEDWLCLDPDEALVATMRQTKMPPQCRARRGTIADLDADERFDTIVYIDVLEHIENDHAEVAAARDRLLPNGHLVVLAPAHQFLFSAFDTNVGHYRRYDRKSLLACGVTGLRLERFRYLDSVGLLASLANRFMLKSGVPTVGQIKLWDRVLVPLSKPLDPLLGWHVGKSVLAIWRRVDAEA